MMIYRIPKAPKVVQFGVTNKCNLNCVMCTRDFFNLEEKHMSYSIFKELVDNLQGVKEVILTGWGEPLLHPRCKIG